MVQVAVEVTSVVTLSQQKSKHGTPCRSEMSKRAGARSVFCRSSSCPFLALGGCSE